MKRITIVSFLLFVSFLSPVSSLFAEPGEEVKTLEIGSSAPNFNLKGVDGKMYSLSSFKSATILVIVFTCNHCPTAQAYEDRIIRLTSDYKSKGVSVIAVSPNDPLSVRLDELGYSDLAIHLKK